MTSVTGQRQLNRISMVQLVIRNLEESVERVSSSAQETRPTLGRGSARDYSYVVPEKRPEEGLGTWLANLFADVPPEFKIAEIRGQKPRPPKFR
jgi:hypothetical protein